MTENREEILANFQACTGIDDVSAAINHLDESNWNFTEAIKRVMPLDIQGLSSSNVDNDVEMIEEINPPAARPCPELAVICGSSAGNGISNHAKESPDGLSSSSSSSKDGHHIHFSVHYMDAAIDICLPKSATVDDLKTLIHSKVGIPVCQQILNGWPVIPSAGSCTFSSLKIPSETSLFLTSSNSSQMLDSDLADRLSSSFTLNIRDETNKKDYKLSFVGTKTILDIKTDLYTMTDIPVRHQIWTGWPSGLRNDQVKLAETGISLDHSLTIQRVKEKANSIFVDLVESDNSSVEEEFEDAADNLNVEEDDIFIDDDVGSSKIEPLIPPNIEDEAAGAIHFSQQFQKRYGLRIPSFFPGTLDDAVKEACLKPAKDRKLLAVYLHHDASVLSNVFCTELLGADSVLHYLDSYFIVWGWDVTNEANNSLFLNSVTKALGNVATMTIRYIDVERLPTILVITRNRSTTEIFTVVHGNVGVTELLSSLIQCVDVFTEQQKLEMREEEERAARELVKKEQDQAYQESLLADRAKEEAKMHQQLKETQEKEREEQERLKIVVEKEEHRKRIESKLPDEPNSGCSNGVTKIKIRVPKGEVLERRFLASSPLQVLLDYLLVKGYPADEYKVISSWPRRDLTSLDPSLTLLQLSLCPQETVILEER